MLDQLNNAIITTVQLAMYVKAGTGAPHHSNRVSHGLVINGADSRKDYIFSDRTVLKTTDFSVYYLPKGSTYSVKEDYPSSGCWAINFDFLEEIHAKPFVVNFKSADAVLNLFKETVSAFEKSSEAKDWIARKNLYDILLKIRKELAGTYVPSKKSLLIQPALDGINRNFRDSNLKVKDLSDMCAISENYLRRIFVEKFNMSPKEYLSHRRIENAKALLNSGEFTVCEVADMCGFSEPCHFSREFKKRTGVSPKHYGKGQTG